MLGDEDDFVNKCLEIAMNSDDSDVTPVLIDDEDDDEEYKRIIKYYNIKQ